MLQRYKCHLTAISAQTKNRIETGWHKALPEVPLSLGVSVSGGEGSTDLAEVASRGWVGVDEVVPLRPRGESRKPGHYLLLCVHRLLGFLGWLILLTLSSSLPWRGKASYSDRSPNTVAMSSCPSPQTVLS